MNKDNFKHLIDYACSSLRLSYDEIQNKFMDYPVFAMGYIENRVTHKVVEVRFDNKKATMNYFFQKQDNCNRCDTVSLCFDTTEDEELFIDYLNETADFDYRMKLWKFSQNTVKLDISDKYNLFLFCCQKNRSND